MLVIFVCFTIVSTYTPVKVKEQVRAPATRPQGGAADFLLEQRGRKSETAPRPAARNQQNDTQPPLLRAEAHYYITSSSGVR